MRMNNENKEKEFRFSDFLGISVFILIGIIFIVSIIWGFAFLLKEYSVWSNSMDGKAELSKADWNRQIAVREAEAKKDAATLLADAEVEKAKGVAKANKIIGDSLKNNEGYLRYLWIDGLEKTNNRIIYVPTETNLPILEATRNINDKTD